MKFFNFKSRFSQKHIRHTLFLCLAIALLLIITEQFFFNRGKKTSIEGGAEQPNLFALADNEIYSKFIGIKNSYIGIQELENKRIFQAKIRIIKIDKETQEYFAEQFKESFPFPRKRYVELLNKLNKLNPKAVGFDVEFFEPGPVPEEDKLLADAVKKYNYVVVASSTNFSVDLTRTDDYHKQGGAEEEKIYHELPPIILPYNLTNEYAGYASNPLWYDNTVLMAKPWFNTRKLEFMPSLSFALQIYRKSVQVFWKDINFRPDRLVIGDNNIPLSNGHMKIYYVNKNGVPEISLKHFFEDKTFNDLQNNENYYNNIWLVGWDGISTQDFSDTFNTPVGRIPGVKIHANILNTVINKLYITDLHPFTAPSLAIFISIFLGFVLPRTSHAIGNILFLFIVLFIVGGGYLLLTELRSYLPIFTPLATSVLSFGSVNIYHFALEKRNKDRIKSLFAGSVSKKIVDAMLDADNREKLATMMKGTRVVVTIFYSDIRGFTSLSEKLSPQEVFSLLNEYFDPMIKIVYKYDGFLDKFIGDCIMAVFSAPEQHPDDPQRAVRAAIEMQEAIKELQAKWKKEGKTGFSVGMGINTGEVILGSLGVVEEQGKWQMTVIGDAVNLAARLYARADGGQTLISDYTYKYVVDVVNVRPLEPFTVKGKADPVMAYELLGLKEI